MFKLHRGLSKRINKLWKGISFKNGKHFRTWKYKLLQKNASLPE